MKFRSKLVVSTLFIAIALLIPFCVVSVHAAEPSLEEILNNIGFTNISESPAQTFPAGLYEAILYAEFAGYHDTNDLSYYPVGTNNFTIIFSGSEGNGGYITPPLDKTFSSSTTFGLSLYVAHEDHRYFTEHVRNPDGQNHSKVYVNLDDPDMYLIGFENLYGLGDRDYNDMVFSLQPVKHYLTVETDPSGITTIPGEGEYNHCTNVTLTAPGTVSVASGTQYIFNHWNIDTVSQGIGVNPIVVHMDANHTATAHYILQHYLTTSTNFGTVSPSSGWQNAGSNIVISATAPAAGAGERYIWNGWTGTGNGSYTGLNNPISITMNSPITETATWTHEYRLLINTNYGTTTPHVGEHWYEAGSLVEINATAPSVGAGERYLWNGWTGTGAGSYTGLDNPTSIVMNWPVNETASWTHQYYLTVISPYGTPGGEGWYDSGSTAYATLSTDTIDHGNGTRRLFTSWSGAASGTNYAQSNPITVDAPKTAIANWNTQYYLTLETNPSSVTTPSGEGWYNASSYAPIATSESIDNVPGSSRYKFSSWTTSDMSEITNPSSPSTTVLMDQPKTVIADYNTQYYLTVTSPYNSPTPTSRWFDAGTSIIASVTSPAPGGTGTQHVCTGWTGTGSVPASGTTTSVTFAITEPSSITWTWKTQHYLTVKTNPSGIATISGEGWYDEFTDVELTAPYVMGYTFLRWDVDDVSQGAGIRQITVTMDEPHVARANYQERPAIVGGSTISIASPLHSTWISLNIALATAFLLATWKKKRKRKS